MPCKECENGKWRWGESGECQYESLEQCESANADYYAAAKLNSKGYDHAKSLINNNKIDKDSKWDFTSEDGNSLLGENGDDWENYAKWFLLENEDASEDTKDRYKFPFGKDGKIYRSALSAIRQRASQFGYDEVFEAAGKLIEMIDGEESKEEVKNEVEYDHTLNFSKEEMEILHTEGKLLKHIEGDEGQEMDILFTYDNEEEAYSQLTRAMLDEELDEYIDKLTNSIKQL
jgi:hypothetical protein